MRFPPGNMDLSIIYRYCWIPGGICVSPLEYGLIYNTSMLLDKEGNFPCGSELLVNYLSETFANLHNSLDFEK